MPRRKPDAAAKPAIAKGPEPERVAGAAFDIEFRKFLGAQGMSLDDFAEKIAGILPRAPQVFAADPEPMATSGNTVIVASALPMSLDLYLMKWEDQEMRLRETRWTEKVAIRIGDPVRIRGNSHPVMAPKGFRAAPEQIGNFAVTRGVSAEFWKRWMEQNKDTEMVKNNVIFAGHTIGEVRSRITKDFPKVFSGLEPIDQDPLKDPRAPGVLQGIPKEVVKGFEGTPGPTDLDTAA